MGRYFFAHSEKVSGINVSRDTSAARPKNGKKGTAHRTNTFNLKLEFI